VSGCPPRLLHLASDDQKIGCVARQAVNGRDDHHVAMRKGGHQFSKLRSVGGGAGDLLPEHLFAPGSLQLGELAGEVLRLGRDAGVAVNHAPILEQNCGTELWNRKAKPFQRLGFVPNILRFAPRVRQP